MTNISETFAKNLRALRKENHLTQREFAEKIGYSEKAVSKWECGTYMPDAQTLATISRLFRISIERLIFEQECYFLGIDGGGTKTELILADKSGSIIGNLLTDGTNPNSVGLDRAKSILQNAIYEICEDVPLSSVNAFAGIAGGTSGDMQEKLYKFFDGFGFSKFQNSSDYKNSVAASIRDEDGVVAILGTGICVISQKNGEHKRVSGWGYLIDNGGSGYNIGKDALNAYFCAEDGSGQKTMLTELIEKAVGGGTNEVMSYIYGNGRKAIATFARSVIEAYENDDHVSRVILENNMKTAAHFIKCAAREHTDRIPIVVSGGLTNEKSLMDILAKQLEHEKFNFSILDKAPVYGALYLAQRL